MKHIHLPPLVRCALALVCVCMVAAGLYLLEQNGIVWDFTPDALTNLSEGTLATLNNLDETVRVHLVFREETTSQLRQSLEILTDSYARAGNIEVDALDPLTEPGRVRAFAQSGQSIAEGSMIVTNGDESRYVVIDASDLYTYQVTSSGSYALTGFAAEQKLTAAIRTVTGEEQQRIWFLTGHDEAGMDDCTQLVSRLESENYAVGETSLLQGESLSGEDTLLILSPVRDLTDEEAQALDVFLAQGGRLLLACDASLDLTAMPHVAELAGRFSLSFTPGIVVEDAQMADYWMNSPLYLMPRVETGSDAMASMTDGQRVILPGARAISGPEIPLSGYTYQTLLSTSDMAYICPLESESMARDASMATGRQQLAVSVSHYNEDTGTESRAIFLGSLYALVDNSLLNSTYNLDMTLSMLRYLAQRDAAQTIPVRSLTDTSMPALTAQEGWQLLAITLILPVLAVCAGAIVLLRRRKK